MPDPIVEVRNITKTFGVITALDDVSIQFFPGEVHGLIGENGAGKSTLVKVLTGYHTDYQGELWMRGKPVKFQSPRDSQAEGIGCVYQERNLIPELTVAENIFLGRLPRTPLGFVDWRKMRREAQQQLQALGLELDVMQTVNSYPQGLRQMAEIARIVFSGAEVILLDEPTGALSISERERLFTLIETLKAQGKTILYISHFLEEVLTLSDRITVLRNGLKVDSVQAGKVNHQALVRMMSGVQVAANVTAAEKPVRRQVLEDSREITFEGYDLSLRGWLYDVSFKLYRGEALGLYGNVGCGALALSEAIFGLRKFDSGTLMLNGKLLHAPSPTEATERGIVFVPEERRDALWGDQSVIRNITNGHLSRLSRFLVAPRQELTITRKVISQMDITPPNPALLVQNLSGGNQQKVILGRWLVHLPYVLMVSEPTNGMDVGAKWAMLQKIEEFKSQGVSLLIISTDPDVILHTCDRAIVFRRGQITAELTSETMTKENLVVNG